MNKTTQAVILSLGLFLFASTTVFGAGTNSNYGQPGDCLPVYGGGQDCPNPGVMLIDKTVRNPATGAFVDNLSAEDPKYRPGDIITFKIKVNNSGDQRINQIIVKDVFPKADNGAKVFEFMSGPGKYDADANTLNFTVSDIEPNKEQEYEIKAKIVHEAVLPKDKEEICLTNVVEARVDGQEEVQRDEAWFCIVKDMARVMEQPVVPQAGPASWLALLSGLSAMFGTGLYLRKQS